MTDILPKEEPLLPNKLSGHLSPGHIARQSAKRPWVTIGLWVLTVVIAIVLVGSFLDDGLTTKFTFTNSPESKKGFDLLEERLRGPIGTKEVVIVRSEASTVDDPAFQQFVVSLFGKLVALGPEIIRDGTLTNYYQGKAEYLVSQDRHTTIIPFTMAGDFDDGSENIDPVIRAVEGAKGQEGFKVLITGQSTVNRDFREVADENLQAGEAFGVPIALIILVLVFGALVAALVPIVLAAALLL